MTRTVGIKLSVFVFTLLAADPAMSQTPPGDEPNNRIALANLTSTEAPSGDTASKSKNFFQMVRDGGPIMVPIFVCSFVLSIFVFERMISLRRGRVIPKPFVTRFLHQLQEGQLKADEAIELCEQNRSPIAEVFAAAARKWNRPSVEVEQAVLDTGERVANHLRKYLRLFNGISTVSPLLGLLGTVLGMISSFNTIASTDAMGRPDLLASGIGEALLTTAAGLCVAIPALVFYLYFTSRVDRLVIDIDALGQQMVNAIASDGWKKKKPKISKSEDDPNANKNAAR